MPVSVSDRRHEVLVGISTDVEDAKQRKLRAQTLTGRAIEQLDVAIEGREGYVAFVSGSPDSPRLELAPLDVGPAMAEGVWSKRTAILTSATIPSSLAARVGMPPDAVDVADVGSPVRLRIELHAVLRDASCRIRTATRSGRRSTTNSRR